MSSDLQPRRQNSTTLVDVLDRVLDKGLVVAGDIKVSVAEVELLTIRIRLVVCSIDKAQEIGLDWWRRDPYLSGRAEKLLDDGGKAANAPALLEAPADVALREENERLREELRALREAVESVRVERVRSQRAQSAPPASSSTTKKAKKAGGAPPSRRATRKQVT